MNDDEIIKLSQTCMTARQELDQSDGENRLVQVQESARPDLGAGRWVGLPCWNNCGGRCLNRAWMIDGIALEQKTDDLHPDSWEFPQQRACLRGRSERLQCFSTHRLRYPMKRVHWQPGGGDKELRGTDQWERISWDEALDLVCQEIKRIYASYGPKSVLYTTHMSAESGHAWRPLSRYPGGGCVGIWDSSSYGSYIFDVTRIGLPRLDLGETNDRFDLLNADVIVMYGCNPAWSSAGNPAYFYSLAQKNGAKFVFIDPFYNPSAAMLKADWIPVRPGTDIAFLLGVAYALIIQDDPIHNPLIDWVFLDRYTIGFSADHLPPGSKTKTGFKEYLLGQSDGTPKTPEWAAAICGTPVQKIYEFARLIGKDHRVSLIHSYGPARCMEAEDFPQLFMTIGAMTGHFGKPGHCCGTSFHAYAANVGDPLVKTGKDPLPPVTNPVDDCINVGQLWPAVLNGKYNFIGDAWSGQWLPGQERSIDIHLIYHESCEVLNTSLDTNMGIQAHRKVDLVVSHAQFFSTNEQYSDIILPVTTPWERPGWISNGNREIMSVSGPLIQPLFEARSDQWISEQIALRLGIDPKTIYAHDEKQSFFNRLAGATVFDETTAEMVPLVTITAEDLQSWQVEGSPQIGRISVDQILEDGIFQVQRYPGDPYTWIGYSDYIADPDAHPRPSPSGKFEISCQVKADTINALGYGGEPLKPYPTFRGTPHQEPAAYPFILFNPHHIKNSHTMFGNLPHIKAVFPDLAFINPLDAAPKGIQNGDEILIWNQYGRVLCQASLTQAMMPGCVGLPHGSWPAMDDESGIDRGGHDNTLCGSEPRGAAVSGYNNYRCDFRLYSGEGKS